MKLYFCNIDKEYFLKTNKSKTGWIVFDEDGNYSEYKYLFHSIPESWNIEKLSSIEIPEELIEICENCNNTGIIDGEDYCHCKAGQREINLSEGLRESKYMD